MYLRTLAVLVCCTYVSIWWFRERFFHRKDPAELTPNRLDLGFGFTVGPDLGHVYEYVHVRTSTVVSTDCSFLENGRARIARFL
jgi:hypothetical protein